MSGLALPPTRRERLVRILGLLGSQHSGERDNAARAAHAILQEHKLTWDEVIAAPRIDDNWRNWHALAEAVANSPNSTQWERHFAVSLLEGWGGRKSISQKQRETLDRAYAKVARRRA